MREVERRYNTPARPILKRGADGRLHAAGESHERDIADIWAEQKRIALAEAIAADKARAVKRKRRKERLLAWRNGTKRKPAASALPADVPRAAPTGPKEIEIKISLPKLQPARRLRQVRRLLPHWSLRRWALVGVGLVLVAFIVGTRSVYDTHNKPGGVASKQAVSGASAPKGGTQPQFATVLPADKTIQQLGGWGRVSPPDKDPVFAYSDMLASQHVVVSEQPLPSDFLSDVPNRIAQLAKQANATEKLTSTEGTVVYIATGANNSQSVIATKSELLILIRSAGRISDEGWTTYIDSLQ